LRSTSSRQVCGQAFFPFSRKEARRGGCQPGQRRSFPCPEARIAGAQVSIPLLSGKEGGQAGVVPVQAVTRPARCEEPPAALLSPYPLTGAFTAVEPVKAAGPPPAAAPSVESSAGGPPNPKPPAPAGATTPPLSMEPIRFPTWVLNPAGEASRSGAGGTAGQPAGTDPGARKTTSPASK